MLRSGTAVLFLFLLPANRAGHDRSGTNVPFHDSDNCCRLHPDYVGEPVHTCKESLDPCKESVVRRYRRLAGGGVTSDNFLNRSSGNAIPAAATFSST